MLTKGPDDRIQYGIDHDSYIYQMARDMDCAPTISELLAISWQRGLEEGLEHPFLPGPSCRRSTPSFECEDPGAGMGLPTSCTRAVAAR